MKTKLTTIFKKSANTPPMWACLLFALVISTNSWADPIAIGTGTVTLNYENTSNPAAPATNTCVIENETCIAFGNTSTWTSWVYSSGVSWNVTIVPGVYDIEATYGTGSWGTKPLFDLYEGETKVTEIFHAPGGETSSNFNTKAGFSGSNTVDLSALNGNTSYTLKVTDGWPGAFGTCIGHISFTPKVGVVIAAFGQSADRGPTTLPNNGSNTINGITVTTNMELDLCNGRTYDYLFGNEGTDYVDISVGSDQIMTGLTTSVLYDGTCTGGLYIQFCSSATYDAGSLVGSPILLTGLAFDNFYTYPPSTSSVSLPSGIIKSARIYRNGNCEWGTRLYRIEVEAEADECTKKTASFVKEGTETGSAPGEIEVCEDASITIPGKGSLSKTGNVFAGWNDGSDTYQEGDSYDMSGSNHTFTAVWTPFTVPQVTNLAITEPVGQTVPLSWTIPGICDLSNPVLPKYQQVGTTILKEYKPNGDYVSVSGTTPGNNQFGVAFGIPATTNIEWLSFEYRGAVAWNVNLWGGLCDAEDEANAYWQMQDPMTIHPSDAVNWASSGELRPNIGYWNGNPSSLANPLTQSISQVAVYANASGSETSDISYEVRNVRYHIAGQEDIDYIVLVRKENEAPADPTDGTELYSGTKSHFLDNDGTKEFGHTYYYRVFAFHEDGTYSASEPTLQTIEDVATYTVTYEYGADNATGDLPTEGEHIEGASFTVAGGGNLTRPGHHFAGWNDGTSDYAAGTTYTMPAENVTLTAQWDEMIVPNVTGLAISDNELSWNIPGKINLSTWSLSNSTPDYFIEYEKPVADGNVYYDNETEELAVTHSSPAWDQYGVAIPIEITNLESVTYYYKGHNIFLAVVKKTEDVLFWQNNSVSASSEGETITRTPTTIYLNNGLVNPLPTTRAITFCTNPDHKATDETFYIRDVFYHTTGMVDIDHVVLMRKEGSASTGLSDGNLLYSGKLSHYVDNEIKPTGTYYYTVFAVHADGTLSSGETVSAAYENPYKTHTRTGLTAGDYGTICLPYAVAVEDRNGADLFEIDKWDPNGTSLTLSQLTDNENMVAGRPYIFQATAATATFRYYAEGDEAVAGSNNGLVGSYVQALIPLNDDNYIIYNNKLYLVNSEAYVGENRAYIHKQDQVQPAPAYRRRVTLSVNGAQVITDIDQINDPAQMTKYIENGHLFIFRDGKVYNAQGQLVK